MKNLKLTRIAWIAMAVLFSQIFVACSPVATTPTIEPTTVETVDPTIDPTVPAADEPTLEPTTVPTPVSDSDSTDLPETTPGIDPLVFRQAVRKLWEDHVTWTRVYIIATLADLPETGAAAERLLQNQVDIGNAVKGFYGDEAGDQLTALLSEHILIAVDLLTAAKSGDNAGFEAANMLWYENADQIAEFLNIANPDNWLLDEMQVMMRMHLDLTLEEATARLNKDWSADVIAYDKVHDEILAMADMLTDGLINQFPDKFAAQQATPQAIELTLAMDKLWEDHVTWTRGYIMSVTSDLPDVGAAAERLLQNQVDIGNAIKPVYGEDAGDQLTALLSEHILIAVDLLNAAIAGDTEGFEAANSLWYENGNQIAGFLNAANPNNWMLDEMQIMMSTHLDLTLEEATARLNADWSADVAAYDKVHEEILEMAGMLTQGILEQFPEIFK